MKPLSVMAKSTDPLLEVRDLSVTFASSNAPISAVRGLTYQVRAGEILGIVGESGSGKTVSSLAMLGLLPRTAVVRGSVLLDGRELLGLGDVELSSIRGKDISMIFQDPQSALTPVYTVGEQIAEAISAHEKVEPEVASERAVELLASVGIGNARERSKTFPHQFSGGMRQRVMIAMAIANKPRVIIADEPTTALDVTIQAQILDLLMQTGKATGAAIIFITHDLGVVASIADRVGVMYAGKLVELGSAPDIFHHARMPYTRGLLASLPRLDIGRRQRLEPIVGSPPSLTALPTGCVFHPRCPMRIAECESREPLLLVVDGDDPHAAACHRSAELRDMDILGVAVSPAVEVRHGETDASGARERPMRETVLDVRDLVKSYPRGRKMHAADSGKRFRAVDGVSLDIRAGETLGLVGESGCGKTTTALEILNLMKPEIGRIAVLGKDAARISKAERFAIRRQLQVVFQDPMASLDPRLPIGEIIAEPLFAHGVPAGRVTERVMELMRLVGLDRELINEFPGTFSGGQRQRINIARALALEPKLVILDEPVSSLDVSIRAGIINLLEELRVRRDLSYLFVAHDLAVVRHIADRVAVMYLGRIVECGETDEVFARPTHPYSQALLSAIPIPDPERERSRRRILLEGDPPATEAKPSGCQFRTRCPKFRQELKETEQARCVAESPTLEKRGRHPDHIDACHYSTPRLVV